jgi:metallo-beta-lactamase class B
MQLRTTLALFLAGAGVASAQGLDTSDWSRPSEPFRVAGTVHFVGTAELGAYLITTSAGHVLIDGGLPASAPVIEASIRQLGFDPKDIRVLLTTQAHFDHVGSMAHFRKLSGARVEVMDGDVPVLESGGRKDYLFGGPGNEAYHYEPVRVDRTLKDGDTVKLGGVTLTARRTPGHTPGSTTWLTTVEDGGKPYLVVFSASMGINPGTRFAFSPSYPGIAEDFAHSFTVLLSLQPDIFLGSHTSFFRLDQKRARQKAGASPHPFIDREGFRAHIASRKRAFEEQLAREQAEQDEAEGLEPKP